MCNVHSFVFSELISRPMMCLTCMSLLTPLAFLRDTNSFSQSHSRRARYCNIVNLKNYKKISICFCRWTWRSCTMNSSECSLTMKGKTIHKPMMLLKLLAKLRDTKNLQTNCKGRLNIWNNSNCTTCIYFHHFKVFESEIHWGYWRAQQTTSQHY